VNAELWHRRGQALLNLNPQLGILIAENASRWQTPSVSHLFLIQHGGVKAPAQVVRD
jgi:hypothetical protein